MPEISLITATYGRTEELNDLFDSLVKQTFKDFEIIIIDQNEHSLVKNIVDSYENKLSIKYIKSNVKGLALNRNKGLKIASGSYFGFPDDDCYYTDDILEKVHIAFINNKIKYVCFNVFDIKDTDLCWKPVSNGCFNRTKIFDNCISFNFFIKKNDIFFDEEFGIGAKFGSGEETDYLFENISKEDFGYGEITGKIFHNYPNLAWDNNLIQKNYRYCEGFGALCKKDIIIRKNLNTIFLYLKYIIRPLLALLIKKNKKIYTTSLKGRIKGFVEYKR